MQLYHLAALLPVLTTFTSAIHLTSERLNQVYDVMEQISTASWENGTKAQAVLEHQYPSLSVFSPSSPFQYSQPIPSGDISQIIDIAQTTMNNRPATNDTRSIGGSQVQLGRLLSDGSSADPASLGIAILLANASQSDQQIKGVTYGSAAEQELNYQLYGVPRAQNGAISHRANQPQLWADFIFMVPPFLAYYGVQHNNRSLVEEAHHQISLYRDVLRQDNGLWQHIRGGNGEIAEDTGLWATGNAWAAQGMLRVWATIDHSPWSNEMTQEKTDLQNWTEEILNGLKQYVTSNGMLRNYVERSDSFEESSGSALVSAAAFRLSTLNITNAHVGIGIQLLSAVSSRVNSTGYVGDVVNPFDFSSQGAESSEAQSFVIMAYAAYDEWTALGRPGNTGGDNPLGGDSAAPRNFGVGALLGAVGLVGSLLWTLA